MGNVPSALKPSCLCCVTGPLSNTPQGLLAHNFLRLPSFVRRLFGRPQLRRGFPYQPWEIHFSVPGSNCWLILLCFNSSLQFCLQHFPEVLLLISMERKAEQFRQVALISHTMDNNQDYQCPVHTITATAKLFAFVEYFTHSGFCKAKSSLPSPAFPPRNAYHQIRLQEEDGTPSGSTL